MVKIYVGKWKYKMEIIGNSGETKRRKMGAGQNGFQGVPSRVGRQIGSGAYFCLLRNTIQLLPNGAPSTLYENI